MLRSGSSGLNVSVFLADAGAELGAFEEATEAETEPFSVQLAQPPHHFRMRFMAFMPS